MEILTRRAILTAPLPPPEDTRIAGAARYIPGTHKYCFQAKDGDGMLEGAGRKRPAGFPPIWGYLHVS
jgi:hypothetical protein